MAAPKFFGLLFLVVAAATISAASATIHFTLYFSEFFDGALQSSFVVAGLTTTSRFGTISVNDNVLRDGQAFNSGIVGRVQGFSAITSLDGTSITVTQNFVFTAGPYAGSTISVVGRVTPAINAAVTELSILGGTGQFRFARGYVLGKVVISSPANPNFILVQLDFYVLP